MEDNFKVEIISPEKIIFSDNTVIAVSYTHLRAHETGRMGVCAR